MKHQDINTAACIKLLSKNFTCILKTKRIQEKRRKVAFNWKKQEKEISSYIAGT